MIQTPRSRRAAAATALTLGIAAVMPLTAGSATAAKAKTATITGKVVDSSGKPVAGEKVTYLAWDDDDDAPTATTAADGTYTLAKVRAGSISVIFLAGTTTLGQYYGGATSIEKAKTIKVKAGRKLTGINATLKPAAEISGTVTASTTKAAVANLPVAISPATASALDPFLYPDGLPDATTSASGAYTIGGLPAGSYRVEFAGYAFVDHLGADVGSWWIPTTSTASYQATVGAITSGADGVVAPGGRFSGTVRAKNGKPVTNALVLLRPSKSSSAGSVFAAITDKKGHYSFGAFAAGKHTWTISVVLPTSNKDIGGKRTVSITVGKTTTGVDFRAK